MVRNLLLEYIRIDNQTRQWKKINALKGHVFFTNRTYVVDSDAVWFLYVTSGGDVDEALNVLAVHVRTADV